MTKNNKEVLEFYDYLRQSVLTNLGKEEQILNVFNVPKSTFKWKYTALNKLKKYVHRIKDARRKICDRVRKNLGGLGGKSHYRLPPSNYMEPRYDEERDIVICDGCDIEFEEEDKLREHLSSLSHIKVIQTHFYHESIAKAMDDEEMIHIMESQALIPGLTCKDDEQKNPRDRNGVVGGQRM